MRLLLWLFCLGVVVTHVAAAEQKPPNIDERLRSLVAHEGGYLPLGQQLSKLQKTSGVTLYAQKELEDKPIFLAVKSHALGWVKTSLKITLASEKERYDWRWVNVESKRTYNLYRTLVKDIAAAEIKKARLALAEAMRNPKNAKHRAALSLVNRLTPGELNHVLTTNQPLMLPLSRFNPNDVRSMPGFRQNFLGRTPGSGQYRRIYDSGQIDRGQGYIGFQSGSNRGARGLMVKVCTSRPAEHPTRLPSGPSMDVLHPDQKETYTRTEASAPPKADRPKQLTSGKPRPVKDQPVDKTVTILAELKPKKDQPQIAAYLTELSQQSSCTVVALWEPKDERQHKPLPRSIVNRPLEEAIEVIAKTYKLEVVRNRYDPRYIGFKAK